MGLWESQSVSENETAHSLWVGMQLVAVELRPTVEESSGLNRVVGNLL